MVQRRMNNTVTNNSFERSQELQKITTNHYDFG